MNNSSNILAKKMLIASSLVGLTILVANNANASVSEIIDGARAYVGAGVGYNHYGIHGEFKKIVENNYKGSVKTSSANLLLPLLGVKFKDNFGIEFGYQFHNKLKISGNNSGNLRIRNAFVDIMGYMPVGTSNFDLLGGLGIGRMNMAGKGASGKAALGGDEYDKFGLRIKLGGQYSFDNSSWSVRGLVGHQQVGSKNNKRAIRNMQFAGVDVVYLI
jgi:opacity protein-like surface antigen